MSQKRLSYAQLLNISLGFWGIQVSSGLQTANTSAIFEYLGASVNQIPLLWLGAPVLGLLVQPVVGRMSDRTWGGLGRRQPYFLVGAIFSGLMLVLLPNASGLWIAAFLHWALEATTNIAVAPARAFVGDLLPRSQRTLGYALQSLCVGSGAVIAAALPWLLSTVFGVSSTVESAAIPLTIRLSYYLGAALCLGGTLWTFFSVEEPPPAEFETIQPDQLSGIGATLQSIGQAIGSMPLLMRRLAWVQFSTWLGIYCIFLYFPTAVAQNILGASDETSLMYTHGIEWAGVCIAFYNLVCLLFSLLLPWLSLRLGRVLLHTLCLLCGAAGLVSLMLIHNQYPILLAMIGVGIAWASILSIPYALLMDGLSDKDSGIYMGIFNGFVVLPQIVLSLGLGWVMDHLLEGDRLLALALGGGCLVVAALLMQRVPAAITETPSAPVQEVSSSRL
ncbi:MFS transporter [Almyronema epifaneia]|uniref:MFS transporter n=1 Tax=Almyronema epifaneia S1 TaxID=2991925 RepID=A0ABW6IC64_9CYAN